MIAVTNGMFSVVEVASSCAVIWKQPSPSIAITRRSGMPAAAPSAAGTANPIVPRPPELIQVPRLVEPPELRRPHLVLADARDDDRVAPRARTAARCRTAASAGRRLAGRTRTGTPSSTPRAGRATPSGRARRRPRPAACPARCGAWRSRPCSRRRSARRPRGSCRSRPGRCRRGSTFASGANASSWPVTRSSNRAPSATSRSTFCIAVTAV